MAVQRTQHLSPQDVQVLSDAVAGRSHPQTSRVASEGLHLKSAGYASGPALRGDEVCFSCAPIHAVKQAQLSCDGDAVMRAPWNILQ